MGAVRMVGAVRVMVVKGVMGVVSEDVERRNVQKPTGRVRGDFPLSLILWSSPC